MTDIQFSKIECEVLLHRLEFLTETDDLAELFPGEDESKVANCAASFVQAIKCGATTLFAGSRITRKVLAEAIEGSTFRDVADEAADAGRISQQKRTACHKALETAAEKITAATGCEVKLS